MAGSGDKTIKQWTGDHAHTTYTGHSDSVRTLCELPGIGFVSGSHDMTLQVWAHSGEVLSKLVGHTALVYSCAATMEGMIASGATIVLLSIASTLSASGNGLLVLTVFHGISFSLT
jgi:phospholipase A-2-activating protein